MAKRSRTKKNQGREWEAELCVDNGQWLELRAPGERSSAPGTERIKVVVREVTLWPSEHHPVAKKAAKKRRAK